MVTIFLVNKLGTPNFGARQDIRLAEKLIELFPEQAGKKLPVRRFVRENPSPFETSLCPVFESLVDV